MKRPRRKRSSRESLYFYGAAVALSVLGFAVALHFVTPAPPRHVVMATGAVDGAYYQFGLRYQEALAREGITLEVRVTAGSADNVARLRDPAGDVDVAFVQGGVLTGEEPGDLRALGTVYLEPLWVFSRTALGGRDIPGLAGKRVAVGPEGSGTRVVADRLLNANGLTPRAAARVPITGPAARAALARGAVDAAFFVASVQAPMLQEVIRVPGLHLMSFPRADAYTRRYPFLIKLTLPEGALDLASDVPPRDTVLLGSAVNLVVRGSFHPALADLLLMTASSIHAGAGLFETAGQFPSAKHVDVPLGDEARRYYQSGPPFLNRYLPFWVATWVDRVKVMLVPLVALMIPLFRIMPSLYRWRVRSKIYRWYHDLDAVDHALAASEAAPDLDRLSADLERVEQDVRRVIVPASYREELYHLRLHIDFLRDKVRAAGLAVSPPS